MNSAEDPANTVETQPLKRRLSLAEYPNRPSRVLGGRVGGVIGPFSLDKNKDWTILSHEERFAAAIGGKP